MRLISDLKPIEKALVKQRQIEQGKTGTFEGDLTEFKDNFDWGATPEGGHFWNLIDDNNPNVINHPMYPKTPLSEFTQDELKIKLKYYQDIVDEIKSLIKG